MKIKLSNKERVAGVFFLLSIILVVIFIVGAALQNRWFAPTVDYKTYVMRGDGLRAGLPVLLSGVDVGEISDLRIMEDNRIEVNMAILEKHAHRIQSGTKASIKRLLGIGEKRIHLEAPTAAGDRLPPGAIIPADEPMDLLDAVATLDLNRYMNTMDRAVKSMEILLAKLEENNRMERMVEAFDTIGPTMQKVNNLLTEINEPFADLIKDPALKGTFVGANKLFNHKHTQGALNSISLSFKPKQIAKLVRDTDEMVLQFNKVLADDGQFNQTLNQADTFLQTSARLMNDGRVDKILTSLEKLSDAEKLGRLIDNLTTISKQMTRLAPQMPVITKEMITALREVTVVFKALQKTWLLEDETKAVLKAQKKKYKERRKKK